MRQGEEDDVGTREHLGRGLLEREVRERAQVGLDGRERLACVLERGDRGDFEIRMLREQPQQLASGISACAGNGDGQRHGFNLRVRRDVVGAATSREES